MPVFFFDIDDGLPMPDQQGVELASRDAALSHCLEMAMTFLKQPPSEIWRDHTWSIAIREDTGDLLCRLAFAVSHLGSGLVKGVP